MDGGFEEFRDLGIRGTEGLEVGFKVTRAHVETSPPVASFKLGNRVFSTEKTFRVVSCDFVDGGV